MKRLYPKAVGGAALPLRRKSELRDEELVLRGVEIDRRRLEEYCRVCTFEIRGVLPVTYPHLLAFPLSMELMTAGDFPLPVMGLVHIENRIEQLNPIAVGERLDLRVRAANLRRHDKGRQFDVVAEAEADGVAVWRGSSTYLHRGGGNGGSSKDGELFALHDGKNEKPHLSGMISASEG
jgi:hypothetical protein